MRLADNVKEPRCECGAEGEYVCGECGRAECLPCRCRYEVVSAAPRLCWRCQAEAYQEWLRTDLRRPPRRVPRSEVLP